jgi:hypothetical protein
VRGITGFWRPTKRDGGSKPQSLYLLSGFGLKNITYHLEALQYSTKKKTISLSIPNFKEFDPTAARFFAANFYSHNLASS